MTQTTAAPVPIDASGSVRDSVRLGPQTVDRFRRDGFVHLPGVLTPDEVEVYAAAAKQVYDTGTAMNADDPIFRQIVNVWRSDETLRGLTLHARLAEHATQLAGIPLRLWHDQLLAKKPHNGAATEYHQDAPILQFAVGSRGNAGMDLTEKRRIEKARTPIRRSVKAHNTPPEAFRSRSPPLAAVEGLTPAIAANRI